MTAENEKSYFLRDLESVRFSRKPVPEAFRRFCEESIFTRMKITGYKQDQKRELLMQQVFELVRTGIRGQAVADRRGIWDAKIRVRAQKAAFDLGSRLYAEKPKAFGARIEANRKTWAR